MEQRQVSAVTRYGMPHRTEVEISHLFKLPVRTVAPRPDPHRSESNHVAEIGAHNIIAAGTDTNQMDDAVVGFVATFIEPETRKVEPGGDTPP